MITDNLFAGRYLLLPKPDDWDEGKSGRVLPAIDKETRERVVVKFAPHDSVRLEAVKANLRSEAKALSLVSSPYRPKLIEQSNDNGGKISYIVTEEARGFRIEQEIPESGSISSDRIGASTQTPIFTRRERLQILMQFFDVLAVAHDNGVINNDIDLKHLFWNRDLQRLIVIDWGNATFSNREEDKGSDLSRCNSIIFALLTNSQAPHEQNIDFSTLYAPSALSSFPQEYRRLFEWSPKVSALPKKSGAPVSAKQLYVASRDWFLKEEERLIPLVDQKAATWTTQRNVQIQTVLIEETHKPFLTVLKRANENLSHYKQLESECEEFSRLCSSGRWEQALEVINRNAKYLPIAAVPILLDLINHSTTVYQKNRVEYVSSAFRQSIVDERVSKTKHNFESEEPKLASSALLRLASEGVLSAETLSRLHTNDLTLHIERIRNYVLEYPFEEKRYSVLARKIVEDLDKRLNKRIANSLSNIEDLETVYQGIYDELEGTKGAISDILDSDELLEEIDLSQYKLKRLSSQGLLATISQTQLELAELSHNRQSEGYYFKLIRLITLAQEAWLIDPHCHALFELWKNAVYDMSAIHSEFAARAAGYRCYSDLETNLRGIVETVNAQVTTVNARYTSIEQIFTQDLLYLPPFWEQKRQLREYIYHIELCSRAKLSPTLNKPTVAPLLPDSWLHCETFWRDVEPKSDVSGSDGEDKLEPLTPVTLLVGVNVGIHQEVSSSTRVQDQESQALSHIGPKPSVDQLRDRSEVFDLPRYRREAVRSKGKRRITILAATSLLMLVLLLANVPQRIGVWFASWLNNAQPTLAVLPSQTPTEPAAIVIPTAEIPEPADTTPAPEPEPTRAIPTPTATPIPEPDATASMTIIQTPPPSPRIILRRLPVLTGAQPAYSLLEPNPSNRRDRGFFNSGGTWLFTSYLEGDLGENVPIEITAADFMQILNPGEIANGIGVRGRFEQTSLADRAFGIFLENEEGRTFFVLLTTLASNEHELLILEGENVLDQISLAAFFPTGDLTNYRFWLQVMVNDSGNTDVFLASRHVGSGEQMELTKVISFKGTRGELTGLGLFSHSTPVSLRIDELVIYGNVN